MQKRKEIERLVRRFRSRRVLVVGDLMLDRYVAGTVARISPEAPVPVVQVIQEQYRPGGAANVAYNIRALGGNVIMAGLVGRDAAARELLGVLAEKGIGTDGVLSEPSLRTTVKLRVLADRQQVVRVDYENTEAIGAAVIRRLCRRVAALATEVDAVIIEDYGKGTICQEVVDAVMAEVDRNKTIVGLDPKDDRELRFSSLTLATPNYAEACAAAGLPHRPLGGDPLRNPTLVEAGKILLTKWNCGLLIITLGAHGMYLVGRGQEPLHMATEAREVFDVSGAGDTVIAAAMLGMAAGAGNRMAARLANAAAGVVVGKIGTAACSARELLNSLESRA